MLKKEVLYKIQTILNNLEGVCSNKLKSELILTELLRVGMLPPSTKKLRKFEERGNLMEYIEEVNEFEDEV